MSPSDIHDPVIQRNCTILSLLRPQPRGRARAGISGGMIFPYRNCRSRTGGAFWELRERGQRQTVRGIWQERSP